jgi:2-C-methyl-D-erythritol 4-phosphate cytidylyltransferase
VALPADALDAAPIGTVAVVGGAVRSQSVREALRFCGDGDPVVVHDAARPLAPAELFERALFALEASGVDAVIAAARVSDTIKQVATDARTVERTLERSRLWAVQTPQVFRREALVRALFDADDDLLAKATDDAWLIERDGGSVQVVEAAPGNIKITTPTDLKLAELLLAEGAE